MSYTIKLSNTIKLKGYIQKGFQTLFNQKVTQQRCQIQLNQNIKHNNDVKHN